MINPHMKSTGTARSVLGLLAAACLFGACSGGGRPSGVSDNPIQNVRNPRLSEARRAQAIDELWTLVREDKADRIAAREALKSLVWSPNWPVRLRVHAMRVLLDDADPAGAADARNMARLMLPREKEMAVIAVLSDAAARRGWEDMIPALVRSLSRFDQLTPDSKRPEYAAIAALRPGQSVADAIVEVFLNPPPEEGVYGISSVDRVRADCWDLLARLDPTGEIRASIVSDAAPTRDGDRTIADLRTTFRDLRTVPRAGEELKWLSSLLDPANQANTAWWSASTRVVAGLKEEQSHRLELRHIEPIRWAAEHRPQWTSATRTELLDELRARLSGRNHHFRTAREGPNVDRPHERLESSEGKLDWADVLAILVIDEALREPAVVESLFVQAGMDREDKSAEYGGLIDALAGGALRAALFPPRPGTRRGDREFVASSDMMAQGDRALAHYHFHVQEPRNAAYAGPADADLLYAARTGRTCVVFTSVGDGRLNADLYQPDGTVIDLGEVTRP